MDEMLGLGENPAFVSTAATSISGTAVDRKCLPPSLMHGKPIPGSSGLENDPRKSQKKGPHLQYQNGFMDTPHPSNGSEGQLGLYFKPDAGSKGKVQNVLSGLHSHRNDVHEVADTQASKLSSDGHNYSYRGDYGRPFNDKSFCPEGGKVVQKAPHADYVQGNKDEILIYENVSSRRQLPVTLLNEKHSGPSLPAGYGENTHYHGTVEDKPKETDERLIFRAALEGLAQPRVEASLPDGLLSVPLLRHQKIALAWMVHQETHSFHCAGGILADDQGLGKTVSTIALILMQRDQHSKFISDSTEQVKRETLNLDEDGDGPAEISSNEQHKHSDSQSKAVTSYRMASVQKGRPVAGTLIVCPASVLRQWAQELSDKVADDAKLLFLVYYGTNRTKDPFELAKYDVILTTYSIVSMEVPKQPLFDEDDVDQNSQEKYGLSSDFSGNKKKKKTEDKNKKMKKSKKHPDGSLAGQEISPLARVRWFRVVLDEAQTIKNYRTQVARACCGLRAKRRWCLSGTPIQNAIDDLYSYFRFLRYDPYSAYNFFCTAIKYPISRNSSNGYKKLQAVLGTMLLRRTKGTFIDGQPIINLPPKSVCLKKVEFSLEERIFYSNLEAESRLEFKAYADEGTVNQNYANILLLLLRLRQACDHPLLVKDYRSSNKLSAEAAQKHPNDMLMNLLKHLESSSAICAICSDPPEDAVITICGHIFCNQCISERLTGDDNFCPSPDCRSQISTDFIFSRSVLQGSAGHSNTDSDSIASSRKLKEFGVEPSACSSSKIRAVLDILQSLNMRQANCNTSSAGCGEVHGFTSKPDMSCSADSNKHALAGIKLSTPVALPEKAIIFSQWTSMLDLLEISLKSSFINYRRLDGTMTLSARDKAVKDFNTLPEVTVMIMSLKAGNLGLNMVAANHVVLLDLWWNPTTEDQAIDRAHRIGQTRPVTVLRLTIENTIEDRILALQEEKRKMVASAFAEDQTGSFATRLTVEDLRYLFMV
ncbi:helicase-like transcription factor CHR28 isoform X2 [Nymphaea colorata]|nr:helicase-like transcription factor CHR28 isoform X2 [Nymphaea colorata]